MSKSKHNGADPGEFIERYGADVIRAHLLFLAPVSDTLNWQEEQISGTDRWLRRVIQLGDSITEIPKINSRLKLQVHCRLSKMLP